MSNPYRTPGLDPEDESGFGLAHNWDVGRKELEVARHWFMGRFWARRMLFWAACLVVAVIAALIVSHLAGVL